MTDKQIACAYLNHKLRSLIPDNDDLRYVAETELSEERCSRIRERITDMATKMREPLVKHLSRSGIDVT